MYQATIRISLLGLDEHDATIVGSVVNDIPSGSSMDCTVFSDRSFDQAQVSASDLVLVNMDAPDAAAHLDALAGLREASCKEPLPTDVIVMASEGRRAEIAPYFAMISDLWPTGMPDDELRWRLERWLDRRERRLDAWQTAQYLEATINSFPSLVWYKTKDGIHEKVNDAFCAAVNKPKDDVQGKRHAYIWDVEDDDPACIESEEKVMASGKTCVSEETIKAGDDTRLLTTYKSPLYNPDGSVMGTVGVAVDITQERAYEDDLVQKSKTLETIFTALECGVLTHSIDGSRVIGINRAALDILGYESEEDMMAHGFDMIAASVVDEDKQMLRDKFALLTNVGDSVSTEYRVRHDDGSLLHVMGNVKLIEKDGELLYQRFLFDNSEQKRKEERRERKNQEFLKVLSESYMVVCAYNLDSGEGELLRMADDKVEELGPIFGGERSYEEAIGGYIGTRVFEDDQEALAEALSPDTIAKELQKRERLHAHYRSKDGDVTNYRQATVARAGNWEEDRIIVLGLRNIDQETREEMRKKELLEEALLRANRASEAKSAFLSNMSHDIRTPMNAIVGFTVLANNHIEKTDRVKEYLDKIHSSSTHLLSLINDILDMSRIESGKVSLDEQPCLLSDVVERIGSILAPEVESKGLAMDILLDDIEHNAVVCDELKLNQILLNLLGNSIKFTPQGGKVVLKVSEIGTADDGFANYRIVIKDNGIGMTQEFLDHIFDPFERERTSTVSGIQGTGLGMAITKSLVDMMEGVITVQSKKDEGTEFDIVVKLKVIDEETTKLMTTASQSEVTLSDKLKGCRILLVDDNDLNREIALTLLEDAGFDVESAVDGRDAIDKLVSVEPGYYQLVLMDIQMPIMNGYEAATVIRSMEDPIVSSIPILAVTADAFEEDKQRALAAGMNGHLPKPIEVTELFKALDSMLTGE